MMLHIDGSQHNWFQDGCYYDFIAIMDDATSEIYYAQLVEAESTFSVMTGLREVIETKGVFCSLYSDRASHFFLTPKAGEPVADKHLTQVGRALIELGIRPIPAYSPQARGRSERGFRTWQGRLPQELRLRGIRTVDAANQFLAAEWIALHDQAFSVEAEQTGTAFLPYTGTELDKIFSQQHERVVDNDNTVRYDNRCLQIPQQTFRFSLARCKVLVCEHLDQTLSVHYANHVLGRYDKTGQALSLSVPPKPASHASRGVLLRAEARRDRQTDERKTKQKRKKRAA
jgi:hypothetical protein